MASVRAAGRAHIENIEAEIIVLKQSIRGLRSQQKQIRKRLKSYKYPVLTLPNELISEIFLHFIPAYPRCAPRARRQSPLLLTHICRKWRDIALATPALWRAITIGGHNSSKDHIPFLASWLSRSGDLPLSIQMDDQYSGIEPAELELIIPYRARWDVVSLQVYSLSVLFPLEDPLPQLRSLEIRISGWDPEPALTAFHDVPRLRTATLWDFTYPADLVPWSQLTSLTLVAKSAAEITRILRGTPQLIHCALIVFDSGAPQPPATTLAYLESLVITKYAVEDPTPPAYLAAFILPALRRLQIPDEFLRPAPVAALASFITKSGCKLHEVLITGELILPKSAYRTAFPAIRTFLFDRVSSVDYVTWRDSVEAELHDAGSTFRRRFDFSDDESGSSSGSESDSESE
ncbi:hypothetical protein B0H11DRAFT_1861122 [Mycena galericulata]|nr:hypothetical protein B0H11DRAFT_1861122 [Mycena galericulata]